METDYSNEGPAPIKRRGRSQQYKKSSASSTLPKIGLDKKIHEAKKRQIMENYYSRRRFLTVPKELKSAHPDKHFVFVNAAKMQQNGGWHPSGYEVFHTAAADSLNEDSVKKKFFKSADGAIHRNEMILAWEPMEAYEQRVMEEEIVKGKRDVSDVILKDPSLNAFRGKKEDFKPFVNHTQRKVSLAEHRASRQGG